MTAENEPEERFLLRLPRSLKQQAAKTAEAEGLSLNGYLVGLIGKSVQPTEEPPTPTTITISNQPVQPVQPEHPAASLTPEEAHWIAEHYLLGRQEASEDYDSSLPGSVLERVDRVLAAEAEKIHGLCEKLGQPSDGLLWRSLFNLCQVPLPSLENHSITEVHDIYQDLMGSSEHIHATDTRFGFRAKPILSSFKNQIAAKWGWSGRQTENRLGTLLYQAGLDVSDFRRE